MENVIEKAVNPLKKDAMDRAEKFAKETIAQVEKELVAAGNDLKIAAPYPDSWNMGRNEYMMKLARYKLFQSLTLWRKSGIGSQDPCYADMDAARCADFVEGARKDAEEQYKAFVAKLNHKIGPAKAARLEGNHVWFHSHLFVTTAKGEKQIWKTQMIVNVSKLGKVFNQFPTRQVKAAK
jgi:hypothetical protein